jgi:hypothetical protein
MVVASGFRNKSWVMDVDLRQSPKDLSFTALFWRIELQGEESTSRRHLIGVYCTVKI